MACSSLTRGLISSLSSKQVLKKSFMRHLHSFRSNEIGLIGIPFSKGQKKVGAETAPSRLRDVGLPTNLQTMGYNVTDYGDLQFELLKDDPPSYNIAIPRSIGKATRQMSLQTQAIVSEGKTCLTLGGDHSMAIGTVHGHAQAEKDVVLVWVDAHADLNPPLASMSGNVHGMVISFLVHELKQYIPQVAGFEWLSPCLNIKDIVYIGLRDIDPAERYIMERFNMHAYTMQDIDKHGISYVMEHALDAVNPGLKRPIHLSFDIDSLDPTVAPSTGTPVPGGMTIREGMYIAEELATTGKLHGIDLVEVNTDLGSKSDKSLTLFTATEVLLACFGKRRMGSVAEDYQLPIADY